MFRKIFSIKILVLIFLIFSAIIVGIKIIQKKEKDNKENEIAEISLEANIVKTDLQKKIPDEESIVNIEQDKEGNQLDNEQKIPDKILIKVPFTSQAPFTVWDEFHEEACEEASLVMLRHFFSKKALTKEVAEDEIQELINFQNKKTGDYRDTTAQETADLFINFYGEIGEGRSLRVVYDFKKEDLKKYLARGYPIIVPAAGRELGNPNFTAPGPLYHNLVLVGYDGDIIITNDPGTRRGEGYKYDIDVIYNAIHDFTGKPEDINRGRKAMIVVE